MRDDELIALHDRLSKEVGVLGINYCLEEMRGRILERQTAAMLKLTRVIAGLTVVIAVATIVTLVAVLVGE